jgi:hypothetical protein
MPPGSEHSCQDDDQGRQDHEDGDEVGSDDPLSLGRDAGEGFGVHVMSDGGRLGHWGDRQTA